MLKRKIVQINEDKCDGCGICVESCAEGAIQIIDGKAKLLSDSYCDGLGACLAPCPQKALTIVERVAEEFDESATLEHVKNLKKKEKTDLPCGCPGSLSKYVQSEKSNEQKHKKENIKHDSSLLNWPIQLKLVSISAPYLKNANLLLAADCIGFALPDLHNVLLKNKPLTIACPKLDETEEYVSKLAEIIMQANLQSITVARMEVPCCGGLVSIAKQAISKAKSNISLRIIIVGIDGKIKSIE